MYNELPRSIKMCVLVFKKFWFFFLELTRRLMIYMGVKYELIMTQSALKFDKNVTNIFCVRKATKIIAVPAKTHILNNVKQHYKQNKE